MSRGVIIIKATWLLWKLMIVSARRYKEYNWGIKSEEK